MAENEESKQPDALVRTSPSFAGMWRYVTGRLGRPKPPQVDQAKARVEFKPCFRAVTWDGSADGHIMGKCTAFCEKPTQHGVHSETRPDGFVWEGVRFHGLFDALENQAFKQWYALGGEETLEAGKLVVRAPQYTEGQKVPLPRFNFFLHENMSQMTAREITEYRRSGYVPTRLRRRGRGKPKAQEE